MPPAVDRASPASTPSPGHRILQRFTSPFTSRPRNITDFYVEADDPHKQYSPGDVVLGSVKLTVAKPVRVTHITVSLQGFVQVYKNPNSPGDAHREHYPGPGKGSKHGEYYGHGFATLFEDEVVLCGDGRLAEGPYQFNFELLFPDKPMPSSLDFERGTISYVITATITRPTPINPVTTCERKIYFLESIDVAALYPPKPRTVTLSPVSRRSKAKTTARRLVDTAERKSKKGGSDSATASGQPRRSSKCSPVPEQANSERPGSPVLTERSSDTGRASSADQYTQHSSSTETGSTIDSKASGSEKSIFATMQICRGGCLRGDSVPVKIEINHTKHVRSMYGVIITLFRHARVDMHPDIPLGPTEKGQGSKYEDPFPKSFSGFGGLSLSGAGSSHTYRKDLTQTFKPLIIDPTSLSTTINANISVPAEAFPTIATVPGGMITFKYYIEVVVDVQGKLTGVDKGLGGLGGLTSTPVKLNDGHEGERSAYTPFGSNVIDTTPLKRVPGVINCTFEVVVGTRNSERRREKRKVDAIPTPAEDEQLIQQEQRQKQMQQQQQQQQQQEQSRLSDPSNGYPDAAAAGAQPLWDQQAYYDDDPSYWDAHGSWQWIPYDNSAGHQDYYAQYYHAREQEPGIALPDMPDESQMSEKDRMRQYEMRLLPSAPPDAIHENGGPSSSATAPSLPYDEISAAATAPSAPMVDELEFSAMPAFRPLPANTGGRVQSVPAYEPPEAGSSSRAAAAYPTDDKEELERRRLQMEASEPPTTTVGGEGSGTAGAAAAMQQPSAPAAEDGDTTVPSLDSHADAVGSSDLPVYER